MLLAACVTPFLAALENRVLHSQQDYPALTLHYCTAGADEDPMLKRLQQLLEQLPDVTLHVYDSQQGQRLTASQLQLHSNTVDIWFCGPQGLATALRNGLKQTPLSLRFHQECFEFR